ncbi:COQ7 protein [Wolfiporia cocos MD-104 SS10]|uniref:5-demethoxyubiquinone hydroxylase, mitochondrial n=1 Tax=Wolfiporia cocos (strain MD-104) TaxID=742152 RepID=A0A2H3JQ72_WOLCO|nr:COQ7 protein [Wolfiporia cocos MD-104 SS10]
MKLATLQALHASARHNLAHTSRRSLATEAHTKRRLASDAYTDAQQSTNAAVSTTPVFKLPERQRRTLESALRVDQAGELAANAIYQGQMAVLGRDPATGPLIQDMWDQEKKHLAVMNKLQLQHHVRPTLLWEVARLGGLGLGAVTALMGREAAMACTEAVETVIGEHYDDQLRDMESLPGDHPSVPLLKNVIAEFRDDELEHLDIAVENDSQRAPAHALLSTVVGAGCKVAIELCKRF